MFRRSVVCALVHLMVPASLAHAQSATVLDFQAQAVPFSAQVLELTLPIQASAATAPTLTVTETATQIHIQMAADILFDFDKANIRPSAAQALHQAAELIETKASGAVRIEGHTDAKGSAAYNQRLSERRANAVRLWLMQREGLAPLMLIATGYGAQRPVAPNVTSDGSDDPAGRQRNRRVELVLQKR